LVFAALLVPALFAWYGRHRLAAVALAGSSALMALWAVYILGTVDHFSLAVLIDPNATRELLTLTPYQWQLMPPTYREYVIDRLGGVFVAFRPFNRFSFFRSFGRRPGMSRPRLSCSRWL
jgi:hypothetical protein